MRKRNADSHFENGEGPEEIPGTGALCADAQADGVPCFENGKDCRTCKKALPRWKMSKGRKH